MGGDGLGEGFGVEGVDVGWGVGWEGLDLDLLDGAVGVEDDGGDGVVDAGAEVEERAGGVGDEGLWMLEGLLEEGYFFVVVGGDVAIGQAREVELAAGVGGEESGDGPEDDGCEGELDAEAEEGVGGKG